MNTSADVAVESSAPDVAHEHTEVRSTARASGIELRGLSKTFPGGVTALDGVDLNIRPGEFFTLLGPSGCGKTTLLRLLAGLETPDAGDIIIGGKNVRFLPPHKRNVNTVFQSYALFPHLNVRENIEFGLRMRHVAKSERKRKVEEIVHFIHIAELLDRKIDQLSGGQRQRIALARALVNEPDVLLLDEPLSALDAGLRSSLQVELLRMQKRLGMTFVFVTHDQQEAMVMSDRIAVLNSGRIQQLDKVREIYEMPSNKFVAGFMGHSNLFAARCDSDGRVSTPFGDWEVSPLTGARENMEPSYILVRPEKVRMSQEPIERLNCFRAVVRERLYRGNLTQYELACGDAHLTVMLSNSGLDQPDYQVDEQVYAGIDANDIVFLQG